MNLYTNFIVSYFPERYKLSYEEASNGFRLYDGISKIIENTFFENRVYKNYALFSNPVKQISFVNKISLLNKDYSDNSFFYFLEPLVFNGNTRLKHIPFFKDFLNKNPDGWVEKETVKVNNWLIWEESNNEVFNEIYEDEHLHIDFSKITSFISRFRNGEKIKERLDFNNNYVFKIKGRDKFFNPIEETFVISNTEPLVSSLRYRRLESVSFDGFQGDIKIYLSSKNSPDYKKNVVLDKFTADGVLAKNIKISLEQDGNYCFLRFEKALQVIDIFAKELDEITKTEHIVDSLFVDENQNQIKIIDYCINYQNYDLYCLSDDNIVYVYDISLNDMSGLSEEYDRRSFLSFYQEINRAGYLEEYEMGAIFLNRTGLVKNFSIKRISPSGVTTWYDNGSWVNSPVVTNLDTTLWKNSDRYSFDFNNYFDELGEWEFYLEAEFKDFGTQKIGTTVFCEFMKPKKVYKFQDSNSFDGIFFDKNKDLCLSFGNEYKKYEQHHETFSYSPVLEEIVTRLDFSEAECIMPFYVVSKRKGRNYFFEVNGREECEEICLRKDERHCILQNDKNKEKDLLFLSKKDNRAEALQEKIDAIYYIDKVISQKTDYINAITNSNYINIEIVFLLEEDLYLYCENNPNLKLKIKAVDYDTSERIN